LGIDRPRLQESDVLKAVVDQRPGFGNPGEKYRYSNTGYLLLAMIVEKSTGGASFSEFLARNIFEPLHMSNTHLSVGSGEATGAGGIISTVDDLLKWDQALYTERLVKLPTLNEAFTPGSVLEGTSTYGFGWNITEKDNDKFVWHTGNTAQFRAFIGRRLGERLFVAMLTNKGNSPRPEICDAIVNIVHGRPYTMPRLSVAAKIGDVIKSRGVETAVAEYHRLKSAQSDSYNFSESELNALGYQLLGQKQNQAAVRIFELNTTEFPTSSNAYDSLGDAFRQIQEKQRAIWAYTKAVELDPLNLNARRMLQSLK
jgi:CubicO group peptidase (beta-lactamase class C family)